MRAQVLSYACAVVVHFCLVLLIAASGSAHAATLVAALAAEFPEALGRILCWTARVFAGSTNVLSFVGFPRHCSLVGILEVVYTTR